MRLSLPGIFAVAACLAAPSALATMAPVESSSDAQDAGLDPTTELLQTAKGLGGRVEKEHAESLGLAPDAGVEQIQAALDEARKAADAKLADAKTLASMVEQLKTHNDLAHRMRGEPRADFVQVVPFRDRAARAAKALDELRARWATELEAFEALDKTKKQSATRPALPANTAALVKELIDANVAFAQALEKATALLAEKAAPTAIVISGGVSLGAYQAGLLYYYQEYLLAQRKEVARIAPDHAQQPQVVTGASAGALNAFIAAIAACQESEPNPTKSLFWQAWTDVGLQDMLNPNTVTSTSLLSRKPIEEAVRKAQAMWSSGRWQSAPCSVNLGVTVTRVVPRMLPLVEPEDDQQQQDSKGQVHIPVQTERVIYVMHGAGKVSPELSTWVPSKEGEKADPRFFTQFEGIKARAGKALPEDATSVLRASAAFPLAWEFVDLKTRVGRGEKGTVTAAFLDGGVFDNNPLRLATQLIRWSGQKTGTSGLARVRFSREGAAEAKPPDPRILYVEPDSTEWSLTLPPPPLASEGESFADVYGGLLANLVGTARRVELAATLESELDLSKRIDVPVRRFPIMGSYLLNFFAFLEKDFREFDFYMGMADAEAFLVEDVKKERRLVEPELEFDSLEYKCVKAYRVVGGAQAKAVDECKELVRKTGETRKVKNLFALLETSRQMKQHILRCQVGRRERDECTVAGQFERLTELLEERDYQFESPGMSSSSLLYSVRTGVDPVLESFGNRQPRLTERAAVHIGGKIGLDALSYRPAPFSFGIGLHSRNGIEAEASWHLWRPLRLAVGSRITHIQSRFVSGDVSSEPVERYSATGEGYAAMVAQGNPMSWWLKGEASLGIGANVTTIGLAPAATRFPVSGSLGLVVLQRFYARINGSIFLDDCAYGPCSALRPEFASDRKAIAGTIGDWSLSLGWRFTR